jgi:hypothetical protein
MVRHVRLIPLPKLNLQPVDELIAVRQGMQGGGRGAPPIVGGARQGMVLNRSCLLMMSALLQAYIEDVFLANSKRLFVTLQGDDVIRRYESTYFRWGNPNANNIKRLFQRLGIDNVLEGLSWQKCSTTTIETKLLDLNELRNKIAHGDDVTVHLSHVQNLRNFVTVFGSRFARHVRQKLPR